MAGRQGTTISTRRSVGSGGSRLTRFWGHLKGSLCTGKRWGKWGRGHRQLAITAAVISLPVTLLFLGGVATGNKFACVAVDVAILAALLWAR
jgi:hypothetical protein